MRESDGRSAAVGAAFQQSIPRFSKHGLSRLGVRALVDGAEEISRSPEGHRRFRSVHRDETLERSVEPITQLIVAERSMGAADTMVTVHRWTPVLGGFVRQSSESQIVEVIDGKKVKSRTRIDFQNVSVRDPNFPRLGNGVSP